MSDFPITAIVSVDLASPGLRAHADFFTGVWGLSQIEANEAGAYLAGTGSDAWILGLLPGDAPALKAVTFRCRSTRDMEDVLDRAERAGCRIKNRPAPLERPGGGLHAEFVEPRGCTFRLIHGDAAKAPSPALLDKTTRLSHVNINTRDVDALAAFYQDVLGFRLTDRSKPMAFLRCNDDHHVVVLAEAPVEGLNHVAFLLPALEGVMVASGRMRDHGHEIGWGVGRHGPGNNVFAYFVDPFGYVVEHTADVLQVDDRYKVGRPEDWVWPPGRTDQWGIAPPKSDACKQAQLTVPFAAA